MMQMFGLRTGVKQKVELETDMETEPPVVLQSRRPPVYSNRFVTGNPARALRLVYSDERGKFKMDPEAVAALQMVKGPLGVVSVCGRARQGKSFILNQLLGQSSGFQVGPTHRPCTKGLWMWSIPLKRTAADGSEYSLLLLDSEGIDAYDQTGTYSTQIFSLAVLLSSMFVYNQMGGIDEAALDKLSLVTEMTKHIRVRASSTTQGQASASEIGQFSPLFLWLLRDFYLDLTEDGRRITPRDYLESALQSIPGSGKAVAAKNEIRTSIRALFPERDCFTLVRPLNEEKELQHLDQIPIDRMRPEFQSGLDALTNVIFERARPKQLGSIVLTGPMFAALTQSFLDAINAGAVPTIATSWQNVEENECRRAHDVAVETYIHSFDKSTPPEEALLQEAHEEAVRGALISYNNEAVGGGMARKKYEKQLHSTVKKRFEEYKRKTSMESELKCLRAVGSMEERLRNACNDANASYDSVVKVLDGLVAEYEMAAVGSFKWQKLTKFLQKSLAGPLHDLVKRATDKAAAAYSSLETKGRSMEERLSFAGMKADAAQRDAQEWKKRYELSIDDYKKSSDNAAAQYGVLQRKLTSLEEKRANLGEQLEGAKKEGSEWQSKHEHLLREHQRQEERMGSEYATFENRCNAAEARLAEIQDQSRSAIEEAAEWRRRHDAVSDQVMARVDSITAQKDQAIKQAQLREDAVRAEFTSIVAQKDGDLKDLQAKVEQGEQYIAGLTARLEEHESKVTSQEEELRTLKSEMRLLQLEVEAAKSLTSTVEKDLAKSHGETQIVEQRMTELVKHMKEAKQKQQEAEQDAKRAIEMAGKAQLEATVMEKEKLETERLAVERLAAVECSERRSEVLQREREELTQEIERAKLAEREAILRATSLERHLDEREQEVAELLKSSQEQGTKTVEAFESLLASERAAKVEASSRAEALSLQVQTVQAELDALQTQLMSVRNHEAALDTRLRAYTETPATSSRSKRPRMDETGGESAPQDMDIEVASQKRGRMEQHFDNGSSLAHAKGVEVEEDYGSNEVAKERASDYTKFTVNKLKVKLTEAGFGNEVLLLRNPAKKDLLALYERLMFKR